MPRKRSKETVPSPQTGRMPIAIKAALIGLAGVILAAVIPKIRCDSTPCPPAFWLVKGASYHPDSTLVVRAMNEPAMKKEALIFELDDFPFYDAAPAICIEGAFFWHIDLRKLRLPEFAYTEGKHRVRFGFTRETMSRGQPLVFDTEPPQGQVIISSESDGEKIISGQVVDENPLDEQNISVELAFRNQENLQTVTLPAKRTVDASGRSMYEFEYLVQNIPEISKSDPRYKQPFFALKVKDEAGNEFMQESTYSAFMVEGVQKFGTRATQVILQKIEDDESPRLAVRINSRSPAMQQDIVVGPPLFTLKIRIRTPKYVSLSWTRLPANLRPAQEQYVMLRQNRPIGISFDTTFTDRSIDPDSAFQYQVLARGSEGKYYASNTVQMPGRKERQPFLRSTPATLSEDSVRVMLKEKNLFHSVWNEESSGFANQFDSQEIKGDKVIIDGATGLMWQQSGSPDLMIYDNAKKWIADLNRKGYAGFHDWRLPTLEEAMSLIEPEKRHSDLYIEPAFDKTQFLIWTSDMVKGGSRAWIVGFLNGDCYGFDLLGFSSYVRAVRSGQSSAE